MKNISSLAILLSLFLSLLCHKASAQAFFVHGTNSSNKSWNEDIRAEIRDIFGHKGYADSIELVAWSGANNTQARKEAAAELLEHISKHIREACITIVGHSHGGNVALWASGQMRERLGDEVTINFVTLNTPCVLGGAVMADTSIRQYHIYCPHDLIVPRGGFNKTGIQLAGGDKRVWPGVPNGGEFSFPKDFGSGKEGSSKGTFASARHNILYKDQYRFKGLKPKINLSCHKGQLPKNVAQWAPLLREVLREKP